MKSSFEIVLYFAIFALVNCFNVPLKGRIVGGKNVDIKYFPCQVSVRYHDKHICGGIIIRNDTILTAAHCTDGQNASSLSIRHGSTYADYGKKHKVTKIIQNPNFNSDYNDNDSSLLKISPLIKFTKSSQPAELAEKRSADNSEAITCGWGVHYENANTEGLGKKKLQCVTVKVVNQQVCQKEYYTSRISYKLMCAAAKGKDNCQGDSGGGLMDKKKQQLIGISSWGQGCAEEGKSGLYGSVPDMLNFIKEDNQADIIDSLNADDSLIMSTNPFNFEPQP